MDYFGFLVLFFVIASTLQPLLQTHFQSMQRARKIIPIPQPPLPPLRGSICGVTQYERRVFSRKFDKNQSG